MTFSPQGSSRLGGPSLCRRSSEGSTSSSSSSSAEDVEDETARAVRSILGQQEAAILSQQVINMFSFLYF